MIPTDQPDSIIRRMIDTAFNQGNFLAVEELLAPDSITHITAWGMPHDRLGLKHLIAGFRTAFLTFTAVEDRLYQDNKVAAHWTLRTPGLILRQPTTGRVGSGEDHLRPH
jgi:hypothetical protein